MTLAVREQAPMAISFDAERKRVLKATLAPNATDAELAMFVDLAQGYQLDPFLKELFFMKTDKGQVTIVTSRDGLLKIAQRHPDYQGMRSGVVKEGDTFEVDTSPDARQPVIHRFGAKRGAIQGAWALVYRRGRLPQFEWADFAEYKRNTSTWTQYPSAMIEKVAQARALKFAFGVSGLTTQEEMGREDPTPIQAQVSAIGAPSEDDGFMEWAEAHELTDLDEPETQEERAQALFPDDLEFTNDQQSRIVDWKEALRSAGTLKVLGQMGKQLDGDPEMTDAMKAAVRPTYRSRLAELRERES